MLGWARARATDMHILQIYKDYFPVLGGIENHVRDLSGALTARGHRVTVLVTSLDRHTSIEQPLPGRPPLVVTYHSDIVRQRALLHAYRPLLGLTLRRAARILPTSPNYLVSSPFLRRHAARCVVVPLGIDPDRFAQADPRRVAAIRARYDAPLALFIGRLR